MFEKMKNIKDVLNMSRPGETKDQLDVYKVLCTVLAITGITIGGVTHSNFNKYVNTYDEVIKKNDERMDKLEESIKDSLNKQTEYIESVNNKAVGLDSKYSSIQRMITEQSSSLLKYLDNSDKLNKLQIDGVLESVNSVKNHIEKVNNKLETLSNYIDTLNNSLDLSHIRDDIELLKEGVNYTTSLADSVNDLVSGMHRTINTDVKEIVENIQDVDMKVTRMDLFNRKEFKDLYESMSKSDKKYDSWVKLITSHWNEKIDRIHNYQKSLLSMHDSTNSEVSQLVDKVAEYDKKTAQNIGALNSSIWVANNKLNNIAREVSIKNLLSGSTPNQESNIKIFIDLLEDNQAELMCINDMLYELYEDWYNVTQAKNKGN